MWLGKAAILSPPGTGAVVLACLDRPSLVAVRQHQYIASLRCPKSPAHPSQALKTTESTHQIPDDDITLSPTTSVPARGWSLPLPSCNTSAKDAASRACAFVQDTRESKHECTVLMSWRVHDPCPRRGRHTASVLHQSRVQVRSHCAKLGRLQRCAQITPAILPRLSPHHTLS